MTDQESYIAAIHETIQLHDYDPAWPAQFLAERERLLSALPDAFIELQHIGSTAVPSIRAKPVIDIIAGVDSIATAEGLAQQVCASGYGTSAEFNATLTDRKWFMRWLNGHRTHHLHLVVHEGPVWHEHLRFRDLLRAQPELRQQYAQLKSSLEQAHANDREAYTDAKAEFVRSALRENY
jgi:GrpB-like predicted nucleotidyltransferase (UPF0157 family)